MTHPYLPAHKTHSSAVLLIGLIVVFLTCCQHQYTDAYGFKITPGIQTAQAADGSVTVKMETTIKTNDFIRKTASSRIHGKLSGKASEVISSLTITTQDGTRPIPQAYFSDLTQLNKESLRLLIDGPILHISFSGSGGEYGYNCVLTVDQDGIITRSIREL